MPRWTSLLAHQPLSPSLLSCGRPHDPAHTAAPRTTSRAQPGSPCASSLPQVRRPPAGPPRCFWPCIGIPEQRSEARVDTQPEHHGGGEVPDLRSRAIERPGERLRHLKADAHHEDGALARRQGRRRQHDAAPGHLLRNGRPRRTGARACAHQIGTGWPRCPGRSQYLRPDTRRPGTPPGTGNTGRCRPGSR